MLQKQKGYVKDRQTGKSNILMDASIKAMHPGKRISKAGGVYYEYRKNRTDRPHHST